MRAGIRGEVEEAEETQIKQGDPRMGGVGDAQLLPLSAWGRANRDAALDQFAWQCCTGGGEGTPKPKTSVGLLEEG